MTLLTVLIAGTTITHASIFALKATSENKLKKEPIYLYLKNELKAGFFMVIMCGGVSSIIGLVFIKNNLKLGISIGLVMCLALFICTIIGALIPFLMNELNRLTEMRVVPKNVVATSIMCFSVAIILLYFM